MLSEISAAAQHISSLLRQVNATKSQNLDSFIHDLSARLHKRYTNRWYIDDAERGSAWRSLSWHAQGSGEGLDSDILGALHASFDKARPSEILPQSFTLWVDPGCVAIRMGAGPGTSSGLWMPSNTAAIKTLYVSELASFSPPTNTVTTPFYMTHRSRSFLECGPLARAPSPSAASISASEDEESCPSLTAASSVHSSDVSDTEESELDSAACSEVSVDELLERASYKTLGLSHADEDLNFSDALQRRSQHTFASVDETICEEADEESSDEEEGDETVQDIETRSKARITSYDGGNVGVLGGGVRLGNSAAPPQKYVGSEAHSSATAWGGEGVKPFDAAMWGPPGYTPLGLGAHDAQVVIINGIAVPLCNLPAKRSRTRGRRSRGRGAGRAARRQAAAALRAQEQQVHLSTIQDLGGEAGSDKLAAATGVVGEVEKDDSARIMSIVRQRAAEVAKDVARRQLAQQCSHMLRSNSSNGIAVPSRARCSSNNGQINMRPPRLQHQRSQPHLALQARSQQHYPSHLAAVNGHSDQTFHQHRTTASMSHMPNLQNHKTTSIDAIASLTQHHTASYRPAQFAHHYHSASLSSLPPLPALPLY